MIRMIHGAGRWCGLCLAVWALMAGFLALARAEGPAAASPVSAYAGWAHTGSIYIVTTPDGADLPGSAVLEDFPVLVRLDRDSFDFEQTKPRGEDIRFSTASGAPLAYQIEEWDASAGRASVWVRVPRIRGNERQELRMVWGRPGAAAESNGGAVFNESNGFAGVWHMSEPVTDETRTLVSEDRGTTATRGVAGPARHLAGGQGVFGGDRIPNYPSGAGSHSTEAWFRAEKPNTTIMGWGNEGGGRGSKIRMQLRSPPHIHIDSDFSDVNGLTGVQLGAWIHVAHTYDGKTGTIYINGRLDYAATPRLNIKTPSRLWLGGWYDNYDFVGDLDEVRVSRVARSAEWVRMEFENQKPMATAVGRLVTAPVGSGDFSVSQARVVVDEGGKAEVRVSAAGAIKIYWTLRRDGQERVVAVDRSTYVFEAGRVTGDETAMLRCEAIYTNGVKTLDIPVTIRERIGDPVFTLKAPSHWDGRTPLELAPTRGMEARPVETGDWHFAWEASGMAVIKEVQGGKLLLRRAQNSGTLTVTVKVDNGGHPVSQSVTIKVREPKHDAWVARPAPENEWPMDNQLYARDNRNEGTLYAKGALDAAAPGDTAFLRVYSDGTLYKEESRRLPASRVYDFTVKLKPGLVHYRVELGTRRNGVETVWRTATNIVCGDAYVIQGQSNAVSTDWGSQEPENQNEWVRTFGSMSGDPSGDIIWGEAARRREGERLQIGYWGMELARRLVADERMPICILNGAVGGTRIDQHQRNPANPEDLSTIYGRLLWRARQARLDYGIRGVLWHQGENDQGADGPTGGYGWETYLQYFIEMAGAWKQDFPNIQHYYMFQIWPKSCSMGVDGSDNGLREVQRRLPEEFSNMSIMSTLGIEPPGGCHFPAAGYAEFARLICPLVERDNYGRKFEVSITSPNLKRARYAGAKRDEIRLEFDQPVKWVDGLEGQFYLDGKRDQVVRGMVKGNVVTLRLKGASVAGKLSYLDSARWSQKTLLRGGNGIAALTFCDVAIEPAR